MKNIQIYDEVFNEVTCHECSIVISGLHIGCFYMVGVPEQCGMVMFYNLNLHSSYDYSEEHRLALQHAIEAAAAYHGRRRMVLFTGVPSQPFLKELVKIGGKQLDTIMNQNSNNDVAVYSYKVPLSSKRFPMSTTEISIKKKHPRIKYARSSMV